MLTAWALLAAVLVLIALNALFVAVEFAYVTVDRASVNAEADGGDRRASRVQVALRSLSRQLSGAQLGITVTSLVVGFIAEPSVGVLLQHLLDGYIGETAALSVSVTAAFLLITFVQMVFGELVPKNWAIAEPLRVSRLIVGPHGVFMTLFGWLVRVLNDGADRVVRLLGFEPTDELASARTAEELISVVRRSGQEGTLDGTTADLVTRSIQFGEHTAGDVMMSRPRVTFVHRDDPVSAVVAASTRTGHSRFPVLGGGIDDVVGVVHFKSVLAVPFERREQVSVGEVMSPPVVVAESMTLDPLMRELRQPGLQLAVVVDEYGGTAGIVTLEDLVEEIVGEIDDEQDRQRRPYRRAGGGGWIMSGLLRPDEVGDILGLRLPEGEQSATLGGLVTELLDRLPDVGDTVTIEAVDEVERDERGLPQQAEVRLTVERLDGHRVDAVRVRRAGGSHSMGVRS